MYDLFSGANYSKFPIIFKLKWQISLMMSYSLHPNFILITVVLRIIILSIKNNLPNYFDSIITTNN